MSRVKILGKGSKKRVEKIYWKRREILSVTLLLVVAWIVSVWLAVWVEIHGE
jgi:hypothetical protein